MIPVLVILILLVVFVAIDGGDSNRSDSSS